MKLDPKVFRRAAELIATKQHRYSCAAVDAAACHLGIAPQDRWGYGYFYRNVITPVKRKRDPVWMTIDGKPRRLIRTELVQYPTLRIVDFESHLGQTAPNPAPRALRHRVMALLLAAQLACDFTLDEVREWWVL